MHDRLVAWARAAGHDTGAVSRMPGHSGISYGFELDGEPLVIRVPPLGVKRSGTTDVLRQVPLLRLLDAHDVPVPRVRFSGDDERWFGPPYLVVERVPGAMPGDIFAGAVPAPSDVERDELFGRAVDALVRIHEIDPAPLPDGWATPVVLIELLDHWLRLLERCEDPSLIDAGRDLHAGCTRRSRTRRPPG
jgi:aminoglycoside phosphotransferase (APT) family kinase protein